MPIPFPTILTKKGRIPDVLVMILAGGKGERLYPLTRERAKPAVPFGGKYRLIDFVLSNFVNSGFFKIKVITQYKSDSLNRHILRGWRLSGKLGHYIEPVPAQMRVGEQWFRGTADAIYQNFHIFEAENPDYVCIFGSDHIYKMDTSQMLKFHIDSEAECTIAVISFPRKDATQLGVVEVDDKGRVIGFEEKPKDPKPIPLNPEICLVSMGNYIFNIDVLVEEVENDAKREDSTHDFGRDIFPTLFKRSRVYAHNLMDNNVPGMTEDEKGYWRDVGSIKAYWETNMDLVSVSPKFNIHSAEWPIHTYTTPHPPAKFVFADGETKRIGIATDSLVSEGCIISGGHINRCILSPNVRINSFAYVENSVLFEGVNIGRYSQIRNAIIDKNVNVPPRTRIGFDLDEDRERFFVSSEGIVVLQKNYKF